MKALLLDPGSYPWLVILGCTVIVGFWHAGIVAVLIAVVPLIMLAWTKAAQLRTA